MRETEIYKLANALVCEVFDEIKNDMIEETLSMIKNNLFGKLGQKRYKSNTEIIEKAKQLHKQGISYEKIGKQFGVSRQAV
jgi:hypothetical protein